MKKTIVILFGGVSTEHEISVRSAKNVAQSIDVETYKVIQIGIDKKGRWLYEPEIDDQGCVKGQRQVTLTPGRGKESFSLLDEGSLIGPVDIIFPVLHGTNGEDGRMQGLLEIIGLPYVSTGVAGSSIGIDKEVAKRLLDCRGIQTAPYIAIKNYQRHLYTYDEVVSKIGTPFFIKPAKLGSSVGVEKVYTEADFYKALDQGFLYDDKLLAEKFIHGRELEVGIFGNEDLTVSDAGEIISHTDFYSYESKYIDQGATSLVVIADLDQAVRDEIKSIAKTAYNTLECDLFARVDLFLADDGQIYVNEINTIPGFTEISMFSKVLTAKGMLYSELIEGLIDLAFQRDEKQKKLNRNHI